MSTPQPAKAFEQIRFTVVGMEQDGRDIIAFSRDGKTKVSTGHGLADRLRSDCRFIESRLPGERPKAV